MAPCSLPVMTVLDENICVLPADDDEGVNQETIDGVHRPREIAAKHDLPFPAINEKDYVTMTKFDAAFGYRHLLFLYNIVRTLDVDGNRMLEHRHDNFGRGSAFDLRDVSNYVFVIEIDPIIVLQACLENFQMVCNISHFDNEMDSKDLEPFPGMTAENT
ncbi:unnamed protein product [Polarella glacialis]|uniref:S-adenosyl-L-homocysteine hydrolase NAD binding domain-containing protein n=1 Tax=Polarella glacialis TaxID=89957 RepID=A0A813D4W8_POLGL|nr:unnamed protein product [Polarella glacialis]